MGFHSRLKIKHWILAAVLAAASTSAATVDCKRALTESALGLSSSGPAFPVDSLIQSRTPYIFLNVPTMIQLFRRWVTLDLPHVKASEVAQLGTDGKEEFPLFKFESKGTSSGRRRPLKVLITAGVHGNEPIGVLTAMDLVNALANREDLRQLDIEWTVLPNLNTEGLVDHKRLMRDHSNLGRTFGDGLWGAVSKKVAAVFGDGPYDLVLDLHGSNRRTQFFLIKAAEDGGLGLSALDQIDPALRLRTEQGEPTGYVAAPDDQGGQDAQHYVLEAPGLSTSFNVGTIKGYWKSRGTPYSYTVEYPGSIPYDTARAVNFQLALALITEAAQRIPR